MENLDRESIRREDNIYLKFYLAKLVHPNKDVPTPLEFLLGNNLNDG